MKSLRWLIGPLGSALLAVGHGQALAGTSASTLVYAPVSAIPTLSEWGQIGLMSLLAVLAYRYLRVKTGNRPLASVVLLGLVGALGFFGDKISNQVVALPSSGSMSNPSGGSTTVCGSNTVAVPNTTSSPGVTFTVVSVTGLSGTQITGGTCIPGAQVPPAGSCTVIQINGGSSCSAPV